MKKEKLITILLSIFTIICIICYIGKFVGTSKFPTVYGDNIREVEETANEYVMEAQNELRNN